MGDETLTASADLHWRRLVGTGMLLTALAGVLVWGLTVVGATNVATDPASPGASTSTPESTLPDTYRFVLTSSCGERSLIGDYEVVVEQGRVVSAESLDKDYPDPRLPDVPTLADLLDKARSAPPDAIVKLDVDDAGLPTSLSLDPVPNAVDDEECYVVSNLELGPPVSGDTSPDAVPDTGLQEVIVGSVVVSVPASWVSTPNGCEDFLGAQTYLHEPGDLGDATCGSVPSLTVVPTDRAPGRNLLRRPFALDRTINAVQVRVRDSCPANAACKFWNGLEVYVPADNIDLIVNAGNERTDELARRIVDSIRPAATSD